MERKRAEKEREKLRKAQADLAQLAAMEHARIGRDQLVAKALGLSRSTLWRRMRALGLVRETAQRAGAGRG